MRRLGYALLTALLVTLIAVFATRAWRGQPTGLPKIEAPAELVGQSCGDGLRTARALTRHEDLDQARLAYLWLVRHCDGSPVLPDVLLETGSLLGHLLGRPGEAQEAYAAFLRRFPSNAGAADATYHLAKLEIDAGNYTAAVAHLTALAERYPDSGHEESAKFLAARAAEMLANDRSSRSTAAGQLSALVPNNLFSVLALLVAIGPAAIQTLRQAKRESPGGLRWRWAVPALVIGLTLLNGAMNHIDNVRRSTLVMEKLDRLLESQAPLPANE